MTEEAKRAAERDIVKWLKIRSKVGVVHDGNPSFTSYQCGKAADEIERLRGVINQMIVAAGKWDTTYTDSEGTFHNSGIGELIAKDLRRIAAGPQEKSDDQKANDRPT